MKEARVVEVEEKVDITDWVLGAIMVDVRGLGGSMSVCELVVGDVI